MAEDVFWQMLLARRHIPACDHGRAGHRPQSALQQACVARSRTRLAAAHAQTDAAPGLAPRGLVPSHTRK